MANPEHVATVKAGTEAIREVRDRNPGICFELEGASFAGLDLTNADLTDADLMWANLRDTCLVSADLSRANLRGANLIHSDITNGTLLRTNLRDAILTHAKLSGASLVHSDVTGANLAHAIFERASLDCSVWGWTSVGNTDFSDATGFDTVVHYGPCSLGVDTIERNANLPQAFLRGCGVPEHWIEYFPSLVGQAFDFYSCFISYSHKDKQFARQLHDRLQGKGIRCWLDEHDIKAGQDIYAAVDKGLRTRDKILLCCSEAALNSGWVEREVETAIEQEMQHRKNNDGNSVLKIIPLNLDGSLFEWNGPHAATLRKRLAPDFRNWKRNADKFEREFEKVVRALRTGDGRPDPEPKLGVRDG